MECRKGRRKGSPILVGLLLAWLLTNGCAVVARNIGECEKIFTILDRGFLPRVNSPPSPTELAPIKAGYNARGYLRVTHPVQPLAEARLATSRSQFCISAPFACSL
ncbi:hypothetical protein ACS0PU_010303 [Formica fusca]